MPTSVGVAGGQTTGHNVRENGRLKTLCQGGTGAPPARADALDLGPARRGRPQVLAGHQRLAVPVRWVHAIEQADAARLLHGGELGLSTGLPLPEPPPPLAAYAANLAAAGVSGLAVELGQRYTRLPDALVTAAERHGMPLI